MKKYQFRFLSTCSDGKVETDRESYTVKDLEDRLQPVLDLPEADRNKFKACIFKLLKCPWAVVELTTLLSELKDGKTKDVIEPQKFVYKELLDLVGIKTKEGKFVYEGEITPIFTAIALAVDALAKLGFEEKADIGQFDQEQLKVIKVLQLMVKPFKDAKKQLKDLQKQLHEWVDDTDEFVKELRQLADVLDDYFKVIERTAKVVGSGSNARAWLNVAGIGSLLTFGSPSSVATERGIIAAGSKQGSAEEIHKKYRESTEGIKQKCLDVGAVLGKCSDVDKSFPDWVRFWGGLVFGSGKSAKAVVWDGIVKALYNSVKLFKDDTQLTESGLQVAKSAFQTLGTVGKSLHEAGGVLGIVFIPLDIYTLVDSSIDMHKDNPHVVSTGIRDLASQMKKDTPTKKDIDDMIKETLRKCQ